MENYEDLLGAWRVPRFSAGLLSPLRDPEVFAMAREMMLAGWASRVVSEAAGYAQVPAFSRAWKLVTGLPPRAWQDAHGVKVRIHFAPGSMLKHRKTWRKRDLRKPRKPYTRRKHYVRAGEDVI